MKKRIIICSDGTWARPEKNEEEEPTNVLKLARSIALIDRYTLNLVYYKPEKEVQEQQNKRSILLYKAEEKYFASIKNSKGLSEIYDLNQFPGTNKYNIAEFPWGEARNKSNPEFKDREDFITWIILNCRHTSVNDQNITQQVFYDWGIGAPHGLLKCIKRGITGIGLQKNIKDCFRYIVHNYNPGDELFFFGFSRGAYTVRSLCGLINNCGILKRENADLISEAFRYYRNKEEAFRPNGKESKKFLQKHSHANKEVAFVGVWDTVGAFGIPYLWRSPYKRENFYDNKMGPNIKVARHALAIDERRIMLKPTIWKKPAVDTNLKQVWFAGCHNDIGGSELESVTITL